MNHAVACQDRTARIVSSRRRPLRSGRDFPSTRSGRRWAARPAPRPPVETAETVETIPVDLLLALLA